MALSNAQVLSQIPQAYKQTAAEAAAGVTPTNYAIPSHLSSGYVLVDRYGSNTTPGTTDMTSAFASAFSVASQLVLPINTYNYGSVSVGLFATDGDPGLYAVTNITIPTGVILEGVGGIAEILQLSSATGIVVDTTVYGSGTTPHYNGGMRNVSIKGGDTTSIGNIGLRVNNAQNFILDHVRFYNLGGPGLQAQGKFNGTNAGAQIIGSTSGTTLTVSSVVWGTLAVGQTTSLYTSGGTAITLASGSGSTWTLSSTPGTAASSSQITTYNAGLANCITLTAYDVRAFQCALAASPTSGLVGSFDLQGSDHEFYSCETYSAEIGGPGYQSGNRIGWLVRGVSGASWVRCRGDLHDTGWYFDDNSNFNTQTKCLTLSSFAEGILNYGYQNDIDCEVNTASSAGSNTYDAIVNYGVNNTYKGRVSNAQNPAISPRYGFNEQNTTGTQPTYIDPLFRMEAWETAPLNVVSGGAVAWDIPGTSAPLALTANAATPALTSANITPLRRYSTGNSSATTYTNFTGGWPGMRISILVQDANTTFGYSSTLINKTGSAVTGVQGIIYDLELRSDGIWVVLNP